MSIPLQTTHSPPLIIKRVIIISAAAIPNGNLITTTRSPGLGTHPVTSDNLHAQRRKEGRDGGHTAHDGRYKVSTHGKNFSSGFSFYHKIIKIYDGSISRVAVGGFLSHFYHPVDVTLLELLKRKRDLGQNISLPQSHLIQLTLVAERESCVSGFDTEATTATTTTTISHGAD